MGCRFGGDFGLVGDWVIGRWPLSYVSSTVSIGDHSKPKCHIFELNLINMQSAFGRFLHQSKGMET
jgi:hypothetical protein